MKMRVLFCSALCFTTLAANAAPSIQYDFGSPTNDEVQMLAMINRARGNPTAEGVRLAGTADPDVVGAYNFFSVNLVKMQGDFATYPQRPPLAWNAALMTAAYTHSNYQISIDTQTHNRPAYPGVPQNLWFRESFNQAGYPPNSGIAENIYAYSKSIWFGHAGLNVDWGSPASDLDGDGMQDALGHRKTMMDYEDKIYPYREIGIAVVPEGNSQTQVGPLVITQNFGYRFDTSYIVGTVYNDNNSNGEYDPGEGLGGVTVMPDMGTYYAVTSNSGAYTIPMDGYTGAVMLTFSGGALAQPQSRELVLTDANRLVDVVSGTIRDGGPYGGFWEFDMATDHGWGRSPWMGWLIDDASGWIYHGYHGWMYANKANGKSSLTVFDSKLGWMWTSDSVYPYFFHYGSGRWLFYQAPSGAPKRWFYYYGANGAWWSEQAGGVIPPA